MPILTYNFSCRSISIYLTFILTIIIPTRGSFFRKPAARFTLEDIHPVAGPIQFDSGAIDYYENINPHCKTIFLIHGWYKDHYDAFERSAEELLAKEKCCNVIKVEWRHVDNLDGYYKSAERLPAIAAHLAEHIVELHQLGLLQHLVEIVGHSMGAHIGGTAARISNRRGRLVDVLIALDPSGPGFTDYDISYAKYKMTSRDATRVVTLYTNQNYMGSSEAMGDIIFYANDGSSQPGCEMDIKCDHLKAVEYYNDSLNNRKYVGYDESGNEAMFQSLRHEAPGHYYFSTRPSMYNPQPQHMFTNFENFDDVRPPQPPQAQQPVQYRPRNDETDSIDFLYNGFNKYNKYMAF